MKAEDKVLRKVKWLGKREKFDIDYFDMLLPRRTVSSQERYKSGLFWSDKGGRYIQYESGLELEFVNMLEASPRVLFYFEQPAKVSYWRGRVRRYTYPDYCIYLKTREIVITEIKPLDAMLEDRVQVKTIGLMDFCRKRGFGLLLTDGKHTFDALKKIKLNRKLEKEILAAIDKEPLRKREYTEIVKRCGATHNELLRVILKHDLYYTAFPFKLKRGGYNSEFREAYVFGKDDQSLTSPFKNY